MTDTIKHWSFSGLQVYETCPQRAYLKYIRKFPEPELDESHPAMRGSRIHDEAENFVRGKIGMTPSLKKFEAAFVDLRDAFDMGEVALEEEWGIDRDWQPVSWQDDNLWGRIKLDAFRREGEDFATVIDYKTGKSWGNEVKHAQQGIVYGLTALMRYPEIQGVDIQFWYLDEGKRTSKKASREKLMLQMAKLNQRAVEMTTTTAFPAKPNKFNCRWCPYRPGVGGQCDIGVDPE